MNQNDVPVKRIGHVAVSYCDSVIIWGGSLEDDLPVNPYEVWLYDLKRSTWSKTIIRSGVPTSTSGSCAALIGSNLYIFAGTSEDGITNKMFVLDLREFCWSEIKIKGGKPSCRNKFGCWVNGEIILYFGGFGYTPSAEHINNGTFVLDEMHWGVGWNNDLLLYNTSSATWTVPTTSKNTPSARAAHSCAQLNEETGFLFGGRHKMWRLNDMYTINLNTYEWTKIDFENTIPQGRSWHSLTPVDNHTLFLFGGLTTDYTVLADGWLYNSRKHEWKEVEHKYSKETRLWHTATPGLVKGQVILFGGSESNVYARCEYTNSTLVFNLSPAPLARICMECLVRHRQATKARWEQLPNQLKNELYYLNGG